MAAPESSEESLALDSEAGKKTYKCEQCGKTFSWPSHLVTRRRTHTGEKSYAKRFTRRSDLVTHQGTHTGTKPLKCLICGKCFTRSSALVTHQRTPAPSAVSASASDPASLRTTARTPARSPTTA